MARSSARSASPMPVPPRPRRTFGDVMKALLAVVALLALVLGVPFGLIQVGRPVPDGPPGEWLSSAIDAETLIRILMLVVWIAWAQFTACVLVEVKAAVSGVGLPARVPGAGPSQLLARQLVAAVLLLGATAASFTPGISGFGQQAPDTHRPTVAAAQQTPGGLVGGRQQNAADALARQAEQIARQADTGGTHQQGTKFYRIQPPEGRHHDSLWEIAQRHLDDGRRYKEIYALNKDRVQPDGSRLSEASLIRPGWIMEMPADAHGGELVETPGANPELSKGQQQELDAYAKDGQDGRGGQAGQGGHEQQRPAARDGDTTTGHFTVPAHHEHAAGHTATPPAGEEVAAPASHTPGLPEALLGAPLLAAGLLAALGRRRRAALWQAATAVAGRRRGMELPTP
ncbi:LysM peptidoglycan-binding domain-containing protein, partial [Streptomyces sp. SolWspMP-sol7th]